MLASAIVTTPAVTSRPSPVRPDASFRVREAPPSLADSTPDRLVAEAPIWGDNDAGMGYAFLPVTIHGHAATIGIDLQSEGDLMLSTAALTRLGVTLASQPQLDSLGVGPVVERHVAIQLNTNPNWAAGGPPGTPPVVGVAGPQFLARYDVEYNFPARRVRLYAIPASRAAQKKSAWLPPAIKPSDCGAMVTVPPGAGTFTGMKMQMNGHPVIGVIEMGPYYPKMNRNAVRAIGLTEQSAEVKPIPDGVLPPGYSHNGYAVTKQIEGVKMTVGSSTFWTGTVQIFPVLDAESVLGAETPIMLLNLNNVRGVVLFNSNSSRRVCISKP